MKNNLEVNDFIAGESPLVRGAWIENATRILQGNITDSRPS